MVQTFQGSSEQMFQANMEPMLQASSVLVCMGLMQSVKFLHMGKWEEWEGWEVTLNMVNSVQTHLGLEL